MVKRRKKVTVKFYLKPPADKQGYLPIYARISCAQIRKYYYTGHKANPKIWQPASQLVKPTYTFATEINQTLKALRAEVQELANKAHILEESVLEYVISELKGKPLKPKYDFWITYRKFISDIQAESAEGTIKIYQSFQNILEDFAEYKGIKIEFESVNESFITDLKNYLRTVRGNSTITVAKGVARLKVFMKYAMKHGYTDNTAYKDFKVEKGRDATHFALKQYELIKLATFDFSDNLRLERVRDLFLFQTYTGLRYSELTLKPELRQSHPTLCYADERPIVLIPYYQPKTEKLGTLGLNALALAILEKYAFQLPILTDQKYNKYLKEIGELVGLDRPILKVGDKGGDKVERVHKLWELLATHVARRTHATISSHKGMRLDTIQKQLGHSNPKQTTHYIKTAEDEILMDSIEAWEKI